MTVISALPTAILRGKSPHSGEKRVFLLKSCKVESAMNLSSSSVSAAAASKYILTLNGIHLGQASRGVCPIATGRRSNSIKIVRRCLATRRMLKRPQALDAVGRLHPSFSQQRRRKCDTISGGYTGFVIRSGRWSAERRRNQRKTPFDSLDNSRSEVVEIFM